MTASGPGFAGRRDPGLQPERTALSWRRTMLTAVVAALICVRAWVVTPSAWLVVAAAAVLVVVGLTGAGQALRYARYRRDPADPRPVPLPLLLGTGVLIAVASVACLIGAALRPW